MFLGWRVIFDFETGIKDWDKTGDAFDNQPTYGDNSLARDRGPSNHIGDWWIGTAEDRPSSSDSAGKIQGDIPNGTITSPSFVIHGPKLRFLIGGACNPTRARAELLIGGAIVKTSYSPICREPMEEKSWDVGNYVGKEARLRLVDQANYWGWGHINFDHLEEFIS